MKKIYFKFVVSIYTIVLGLQFSCAQGSLFNENPSIWIKGNPTDSIFFNGNAVFKNNELHELKNKLAGKSTLFVVFKSNPIDSTNFVRLDFGPEKIFIRNNKILNQQNELVCNLLNSPHGQIITYFQSNSKLSAKSRNKLFIDLLGQTNDNCQFLELIYFPKILSPVATRKIETYLSVKYGISLKPDKDYISVKNDTIWKAASNSDYSNRVTGVMKNIFHTQLRSKNSENDHFFIAYDTLNNAVDEMLLVGDNNNSLSFNQELLFNRKWHYIKSQTADSLGISTFKIQFKKSVLGIDTNNINLIVAPSIENFDQISSCTVYPITSQDSSYIYFDGLVFNDSGYFTFATTEALSILERKTLDCKSNSLLAKFSILGGSPPYEVVIIDEKLDNKKSFNLQKSSQFNQEISASNNIKVEVTDKNNRKAIYSSKNQSIETFVTIPREVYFVKGNEKIIMPTIKEEKLTKLSYKWIYLDSVISTEKQVTIKQPGLYKLIVIDGSCELNFTINAIEVQELVSNYLNLIQNPIEANQNFTIDYQLINSENIELNIFDSSGKLIISELLQNSKKGQLHGLISTSGVYFIKVKTPSFSKSFKLIVQ